jgi:endoglycosylceramidase
MESQEIVTICCLLLLFCTLCDGAADVHTDQTFIKDEAGRIRLYHGANFVNKGFPWYPPELLDPVFVTNMSTWGLNFVRLGYV